MSSSRPPHSRMRPPIAPAGSRATDARIAHAPGGTHSVILNVYAFAVGPGARRRRPRPRRTRSRAPAPRSVPGARGGCRRAAFTNAERREGRHDVPAAAGGRGHADSATMIAIEYAQTGASSVTSTIAAAAPTTTSAVRTNGPPAGAGRAAFAGGAAHGRPADVLEVEREPDGRADRARGTSGRRTGPSSPAAAARRRGRRRRGDRRARAAGVLNRAYTDPITITNASPAAVLTSEKLNPMPTNGRQRLSATAPSARPAAAQGRQDREHEDAPYRGGHTGQYAAQEHRRPAHGPEEGRLTGSGISPGSGCSPPAPTRWRTARRAVGSQRDGGRGYREESPERGGPHPTDGGLDRRRRRHHRRRRGGSPPGQVRPEVSASRPPVSARTRQPGRPANPSDRRSRISRSRAAGSAPRDGVRSLDAVDARLGCRRLDPRTCAGTLRWALAGGRTRRARRPRSARPARVHDAQPR